MLTIIGSDKILSGFRDGKHHFFNQRCRKLCESKLQVQMKFKLKAREGAPLVRELLSPRGRKKSLEIKTFGKSLER